MLDIQLLLEDKGGNPEIIRESQRRRGANVEIVDEIIALYKEWTAIQFDGNKINKQINDLQKEIGKKFKAKEDPAELVAEKEKLTKTKEDLVAKTKEAETAWKTKLGSIGNIVHSSVPTSLNEDNNEIIRTFNYKDVEPVQNTNIMSHHEVLTRLDGYDQERGANVAGHRGFFLTETGVDLNLALINYGLSFLRKRSFKKLQTPYFMNKDVMAKTAQLSDFDEELYKVSGDGEDKYLIATSEQPISAFHMNEWFEKPSEQLPIRYAGYSTCFRKEAGAHGKDTWGIFRVHQFEKIEQFVLCDPEKSWDMFNEMIENSEAFYQSLGLSYRVVAIVSGALNNAAAKKYDLEAWFPYQGAFKELVSCSNCTDYQSRNLEIRCGVKKMGDREKKYVHCLNSTLCATERAMCAVLENWQREDGLEIPPALVPYMDGRTFIPYTKPAPKTPKQAKV